MEHALVRADESSRAVGDGADEDAFGVVTTNLNQFRLDDKFRKHAVCEYGAER